MCDLSRCFESLNETVTLLALSLGKELLNESLFVTVISEQDPQKMRAAISSAFASTQYRRLYHS